MMKPTDQEIKKAVIVAAGRSTRLHPLTLHKPKGLLEIKGESLLGRSIRILKENGIREIAIVVGFEADQIVNRFGTDCTCIFNPFYPLCNNMGSLWFAKDFAENGPFVYLHSDLIYDPDLLKNAFQTCEARSDDIYLATDYGPVDEESMKVSTTDQGFLVESNKEIPLAQASGEWTGIAFIRNSRRLFEIIQEKLLNGDYNKYDTSAFVRMAQEGLKVYCGPTQDLPWKEIDFIDDYKAAQLAFG